MLDFMDAYTLWRAHPFPSHAVDPVILDFHSDLVLADTYVLTCVDFVDKGRYRPVVVDVLGFLEELRGRIDGYHSGDAGLMEIARAQRAYCALQWEMYSRFLALAPNG